MKKISIPIEKILGVYQERLAEAEYRAAVLQAENAVLWEKLEGSTTKEAA